MQGFFGLMEGQNAIRFDPTFALADAARIQYMSHMEDLMSRDETGPDELRCRYIIDDVRRKQSE